MYGKWMDRVYMYRCMDNTLKIYRDICCSLDCSLNPFPLFYQGKPCPAELLSSHPTGMVELDWIIFRPTRTCKSVCACKPLQWRHCTQGPNKPGLCFSILEGKKILHLVGDELIGCRQPQTNYFLICPCSNNKLHKRSKRIYCKSKEDSAHALYDGYILKQSSNPEPSRFGLV